MLRCGLFQCTNGVLMFSESLLLIVNRVLEICVLFLFVYIYMKKKSQIKIATPDEPIAHIFFPGAQGKGSFAYFVLLFFFFLKNFILHCGLFQCTNSVLIFSESLLLIVDRVLEVVVLFLCLYSHAKQKTANQKSPPTKQTNNFCLT